MMNVYSRRASTRFIRRNLKTLSARTSRIDLRSLKYRTKFTSLSRRRLSLSAFVGVASATMSNNSGTIAAKSTRNHVRRYSVAMSLLSVRRRRCTSRPSTCSTSTAVLKFRKMSTTKKKSTIIVKIMTPFGSPVRVHMATSKHSTTGICTAATNNKKSVATSQDDRNVANGCSMYFGNSRCASISWFWALERCMRFAGSGAMPSVSTVGLSASFCSPGGSPLGSSMVTLPSCGASGCPRGRASVDPTG
mmetsp:Transcript_19779/g.56145  ORF Transcript_19779/g.56145 Transcript_19779/m.56145 type:complete len:248 (-) Transcript_19779:85-828(-)